MQIRNMCVDVLFQHSMYAESPKRTAVQSSLKTNLFFFLLLAVTLARRSDKSERELFNVPGQRLRWYPWERRAAHRAHPTSKSRVYSALSLRGSKMALDSHHRRMRHEHAAKELQLAHNNRRLLLPLHRLVVVTQQCTTVSSAMRSNRCRSSALHGGGSDCCRRAANCRDSSASANAPRRSRPWRTAAMSRRNRQPTSPLAPLEARRHL